MVNHKNYSLQEFAQKLVYLNIKFHKVADIYSNDIIQFLRSKPVIPSERVLRGSLNISIVNSKLLLKNYIFTFKTFSLLMDETSDLKKEIYVLNVFFIYGK